MKVAVIGGGWAGLAAAVELTAAGVDTTVFEAGRVPGGRARSITVDGRRLDNGQHILLGAYREILEVMRRIGADPEQLFDRRPLQLVDDAGFRMALPKWPVPLNVAWGLLTAHGVGWREKMATARWMQGVKARGFRLAANTTVAEWLDGAGQTGELRRHLWEPLCLAALNIPAGRASAQVFANVLRDSLGSPRREDTDLLLPRVDLGRLLPEPASNWLAEHGATLRFTTRIDALETAPGHVTVAGERFAAAIIATAPQHAGKLLPEMTANYDYEPIATVYLQFGPRFRLPFPLFKQTGKYGQWAVDRGDGLIGCVLSGHGDWEALTDEELAATLQAELPASGPATWQRVIREKRATFSCQPGIPRPACVTSHPRVLLAGDYTWADYPATLEGAVRSGRRAARLLIANRDNSPT
ncbi:MAG: FAD-dependent oxidoreductase [Dechloromonas sp.]|uniref:FAD-dependent oxidoreductase n=1 Tax=Candidatus Dechloromonas phosphorivorans TaxID=2899244 RepID=A0A9D7QI22_9RHOO|nr:FAD-dependent oxidoreductase [Candidatus Dechloromonas phosphorivorans]